MTKSKEYFLVLDQGNSRLKVAIFDSNRELIHTDYYKKKVTTKLNKLIKKYSPSATLYSASGKTKAKIISLLDHLPKVVFLDSSTPLPIALDYRTPTTLGTDRIANACGAAKLFPNKPVLIVDFGTCLTYNLIDDNHCFLGGAIAPGVFMRAQAMHTFTQNLPLVHLQPVDSFIGKDTKTCLNIGIMQGVKHEIQGYIDQYRKNFPNLTIIFTGGDHSYFVNTFECLIFANLNLTAIGLNEILRYNI